MSIDLETQIGNLFEEIRVEQSPLTMDEIVEHRFRAELVVPVGPVSAPVRTRGRWSFIVTAAAATVVFVVLGGMALLQRTTDVTTNSSSWFRVPHDESVLGGPDTQWMTSVTVGGPGFVAVGWEGQEPLLRGPAVVWTSVDGVAWSRISDNQEAFEPGEQGFARINGVTSGGPGLVAVGADDGAVVWTSTDGYTWSRVPNSGSLSGETLDGHSSGGEMKSVTAGGPGLVAVGKDGDDAAVWTSVDGVAWIRVPHDEAVFGGANDQTMLSVTTGGPGLVAVGRDGLGSFRWDIERGDQVAAVWTSVDGMTWSRVPHDEAVFAAGDQKWGYGAGGRPAMLSVTAGGPGLVAVGLAETGVPVWTSVDGIIWTRIPSDGLMKRGALRSVTTGEEGLVAVGWASGAAVWTSVDGMTWLPALEPSLAEGVFGGVGIEWISGVAAGDDGLVAVGAAGFLDDGDGDAAVWRLKG